MDGVPLKFRGRECDTWKIVYGCYVQYKLGDEIVHDIIDENGVRHSVEDVVQLIGYDSNGEEVYEGDAVILEGTYRDYAEAVLDFGRFPGFRPRYFTLRKGD